ncbi:uncharacterized protein LOC135502216 [Lineus longissimus]|uniref:uncharacterized protein LOC135502216 n=1 Tax=Lineus longissimus TaxID=88925 RepID=UPI00315CCD49
MRAFSIILTVPRVLCLEEGPTIALKEVATTPAPVGTNDVHHQKKKKAKRARRVEQHHIVEEDGEGRFTNSETKHLPQAKAQHADSQQAEKERPCAPSPSPVVCSIVDGGESHLQVCTPSTKNKKTKPERNEHRASTKNRVRDKESSQSKKKKYREGQQPSRRKCSSPVIQVQGCGVATPQEVVSNTSFDTDPPSTSEDDNSEQGERADFNSFLCQEADSAEEGTLFHRLRARTNLALSKAELNVTRFLSNHYSFLYSNLTNETGRANFREYFHAGFEHFIELILEKEVQHKVFVRSSEYAKRVNKAQCLESEYARKQEAIALGEKATQFMDEALIKVKEFRTIVHSAVEDYTKDINYTMLDRAAFDAEVQSAKDLTKKIFALVLKAQRVYENEGEKGQCFGCAERELKFKSNDKILGKCLFVSRLPRELRQLEIFPKTEKERENEARLQREKIDLNGPEQGVRKPTLPGKIPTGGKRSMIGIKNIK